MLIKQRTVLLSGVVRSVRQTVLSQKNVRFSGNRRQNYEHQTGRSKDLGAAIVQGKILAGRQEGNRHGCWVNPKFCVNAKLWCKIERKYFKAGAAQAAAAFSTKITALRGDVKGGGVSLRSSQLLTFRLQPVSPACGRQRTPPTVRELRSSPAAFRSTSS